MSDGLLELLVLGKIPGTEVYIDYTTSLLIGGGIIIVSVAYFSATYYRRTLHRLKNYSKEKLIDLKTI